MQESKRVHAHKAVMYMCGLSESVTWMTAWKKQIPKTIFLQWRPRTWSSKKLLEISVKARRMLARRPLGGSLVTWQQQERNTGLTGCCWEDHNELCSGCQQKHVITHRCACRKPALNSPLIRSGLLLSLKAGKSWKVYNTDTTWSSRSTNQIILFQLYLIS